VASANDLSVVWEAVSTIKEALEKLTPSQRSTANDIVNRLLGGAPGAGAPGAGAPSQGEGQGTSRGAGLSQPGKGGATSIKAFLANKKPGTDAEKLACIVYYLSQDTDPPHFKAGDLRKAATAAAVRFSNVSMTMMNATRQNGYLVSAGGHHSHQITGRGEALVEALPDREAVKVALDAHPFRSGGRSAKKRAKKKA
jgi:hypothetical protein